MDPVLGIDFGTTYSAMAWCNPNTVRADVLLNAEGELKTPSVVYFGAAEVVVGKPALHLLEDPDESRRVVLSCKRHLQSNAVLALPGRRVTMVEVAAAILAKLKRDAEELHFHAPVRRAVITCPAAFGELERERIEQAAQQAGFAEVQLLEEPVAAALAYVHGGLQVGQHILVYDLGGGTFDLAVLLREGENGFRLALEPRGLRACGGDDFDRALYDYLDARIRRAVNVASHDGRTDPNVLLRCRDCKESLSHLSSSLFSVYVNRQRFQERVERRTFEGLIQDRLEETIRLTQDLVADTARRGRPVDTVVLIGGSARIPQVAARLAEVLPVQPHKWQQQDVAVALGAAYFAWEPARPPLPSIQNIHGWSAQQVQALQRQTALALGLAVEFRDTLKDGSQGPLLIAVPGGRFLMGSPADEPGRDSSERQHEVEVGAPGVMGGTFTVRVPVGLR